MAFLFACYCGLRVGDVTDLRWSDISVNSGRHFVSVVMQKNSKPISLPFPAKALSWLFERGDPEALPQRETATERCADIASGM